ncbi:MAG: hypothetical protein WBE80_16890 [Methylocella sp.]
MTKVIRSTSTSGRPWRNALAASRNSTGVFNSGGTIFTYGDNDINGNTVDDVEGTLTIVATR